MELLLPGILEINPYYNMGWTLLGVSQEMNGHYAEATSSLEYALAINPDDIPANVTYAQCMQVMGNFDRAIQYLLRYRELTNDFSQDIAIAKCYLNLKDYPNVRKYLIHPFEHVKNHPDTRQITDELMELAELLYACDEIDKTDYDVCIVGCGAYGFLLAAHCKRMGRKAVHLGGTTQLLFGIKGKRWENPDYGFNGVSYQSFMTPQWVRPSTEETPAKSSDIEGGCYW